MKIQDARITILCGKETTIELYDANSGVLFAKATLNSEQFATALGRLSMTNCEIEVPNLDTLGKLNKAMENKHHEFEIPKELSSFNKRDDPKVYELALASTPEGWKPDNYFNSQNSFFQKDGKQYARCTIRRWVDISETKKEA